MNNLRREAPEGATFYLAIGDGWVAARAPSEKEMCRWFKRLSMLSDIHCEGHLEWMRQQRVPYELQTRPWWLEDNA